MERCVFTRALAHSRAGPMTAWTTYFTRRRARARRATEGMLEGGGVRMRQAAGGAQGQRASGRDRAAPDRFVPGATQPAAPVL